MASLRISLFLFLFSSFVTFAQIQPASYIRLPDENFIKKNQTLGNAHSRSQQCGPDTVYYGYAKATSLRGLRINTVNSADKAGQWFDAPQQMMLYGFTFFAWQASLTSDTVTLNCKVILAGSDSLPTGPVVASTTVQVDSTYGNGSLSLLEKTAVFASPVLINFPYVVVVETASPVNVALVTNDSTDGGSEWLGMASIPGAGWLHSYAVEVSGIPLNSDFVFNPIVTYEVDANFTADVQCVMNGGDVQFTNTTVSPVLHSRFYNQYVFNNTTQLIYTWDYDDGSPLDLLEDTTHTFPAGADYNVRLNSNIAGWATVCQENYTMTINPSTVSGFSYIKNGLTVQFTNSSSGLDSCYWNFGDGSTSAELNPTHTYASENNYNVTLVSIGPCEGDTLKTLISLCNALSSGFSYSVAGMTVDFSVSSITGSATFNWNFGDGSVGSGIAPTHHYDSAGTYSVCLVAGNACETDTTCQTVAVIATSVPVIVTNEWKAYPNPLSEELFFDFGTSNGKMKEITLFNEQGVAVKKLDFEETTRPSLSVSDVPSGVYILKINGEEGVVFKKVVISR